MRKYNKPTIEFLEINSVNNIASLSGTLASGNPYGDNATENITPDAWGSLFDNFN